MLLYAPLELVAIADGRGAPRPNVFIYPRCQMDRRLNECRGCLDVVANRKYYFALKKVDTIQIIRGLRASIRCVPCVKEHCFRILKSKIREREYFKTES